MDVSFEHSLRTPVQSVRSTLHIYLHPILHNTNLSSFTLHPLTLSTHRHCQYSQYSQYRFLCGTLNPRPAFKTNTGGPRSRPRRTAYTPLAYNKTILPFLPPKAHAHIQYTNPCLKGPKGYNLRPTTSYMYFLEKPNNISQKQYMKILYNLALFLSIYSSAELLIKSLNMSKRSLFYNLIFIF